MNRKMSSELVVMHVDKKKRVCEVLKQRRKRSGNCAFANDSIRHDLDRTGLWRRKEFRPRLEELEPRHMLAVSWDGGGDGTSWRDAANWSGNVLPTSADDVVIDVPGEISVVHNTDVDT